MSAGKLNKRIRILKYAEVEDGAGGFLDDFKTEEGWELVKEIWASIEPLSGRAFEQAQQAQSEVTHKIIIRYTKDIDKSMVIKFNNRRFDIEHIINQEEKNRYLEVRGVERI